MKQIYTQQFERKFDDKGYIHIFVEGKWKREHIYVVEQFIERQLEVNECIHHIDENKMNNDIYNLALFTFKEHSHFHRQIKQFGMTNPRKRQIENNIIQVKLREINI